MGMEGRETKEGSRGKDEGELEGSDEVKKSEKSDLPEGGATA